MDLAAIIINYRTGDLTARVTTALLPELAAAGTFHVYVIDNQSGDDSLEILKARAASDGWGDRVTIVAAPRNGGYGYGINVGVEHARASADPPDYYYILNSDAFADPGSVKTLLEFMRSHPDAGLCGADVRGTDGISQGAAFRFPTFASEFNDSAKTAVIAWLMAHRSASMPLPDDVAEVDWVSGACMIIRRAAFEQIGPFDEGFFLYFEEVDFCQRARNAGWRTYCLPRVTVTHIGSVSTGMGDPARPMPNYWFESRHRYFIKHHGRRYTAFADLSWIAGFVLGEAKRSLLRRPRKNPERMLFDFVRTSLLHLTDRTFPAEAVSAQSTRDPVAPIK